METKEQIDARMAKARAARQTAKENGEEVEEKKSPTTPWKPSKKLNIPEHMKDPRFVYRFVNTKKEGNELKKLDEGWEYDKELSAKLATIGAMRGINDGTPLDSVYRIRELVVMRMPKEMANERNKYYLDKTKIDTTRMKQGMRTQMDTHGATQEAGVYADSYSLAGFNKEEKEEIFRR